MKDGPQKTDTEPEDKDDPTDPDFWHKVASMTVLDLVRALVEFLERKK